MSIIYYICCREDRSIEITSLQNRFLQNIMYKESFMYIYYNCTIMNNTQKYGKGFRGALKLKDSWRHSGYVGPRG